MISTALEREDVIREIRMHLRKGELLTQLAEECTELAQAALKVRRAIEKINPTPLSEKDAWVRFYAELADVCTCLDVLGANSIRAVDGQVWAHVDARLERWLFRLEYGCDEEH